MAIIKPFKGIRPPKELVEQVASRPYDVLNSEEAREEAKGNEKSLYHIIKPEIDFPAGTDEHDAKVYDKAAENFRMFQDKGWLVQDEKENYYVYAQTMNGKTQYGLVVGAYVPDYMNGTIKKHELTRADKEQDRINHVDYCDANTGPIFLTYRDNATVGDIVKAWQAEHEPVYDFVSDGVAQTVWVIDCPETIKKLSSLFAGIDSLYIADGHHRAASAVKVGKKRREQNPGYTGNEEFNFFLAVLFAQSELAIMDYNRVIKDLNGLTQDEFIAKISESFTVESAPESPYKPQDKHTFGMYLGGKWYKLTAKDGTFDASDPVAALDVSILQQNLISPVLGIDDPRTDKRIDFVGGIRGLKELERRAQSDMCLAFSMFPTTVDDLMDIADAGKIMPPKSTWFEPKLLSGLFVHKLK